MGKVVVVHRKLSGLAGFNRFNSPGRRNTEKE
jgi:hypothetical protein